MSYKIEISARVDFIAYSNLIGHNCQLKLLIFNRYDVNFFIKYICNVSIRLHFLPLIWKI